MPIVIGAVYHLRSPLYPDNHFEIRVTRVEGERIVGVITNDYKDDIWHPAIGVLVFVYESEWVIHPVGECLMDELVTNKEMT